MPEVLINLPFSPQTQVGHSCPGGVSMRQLESAHNGVGHPSIENV